MNRAHAVGVLAALLLVACADDDAGDGPPDGPVADAAGTFDVASADTGPPDVSADAGGFVEIEGPAPDEDEIQTRPGTTPSMPRFSPSGEQIAYLRRDSQAGVSDNTSDVVVTDVVTGTDTLLTTTDAGANASLAWHPGFGVIFFTRSRDIASVSARGGEALRVTAVSNPRGPDVSPDGAQIVCSITGGSSMFFTPSDGSLGRESVPDGGRSPRFSPDGRQVAFIDRDDWVKLYDIETETIEPVLGVENYLAHLAWFSDGQRLAVTTRAGVEIVDLEAHTRRLLVRAGAAAAIDVSPDDGSIIYTVNGGISVRRLRAF